MPHGAYSMMGDRNAHCVTANSLESLRVFFSCSLCMLQSTMRNASATRVQLGRGRKKHLVFARDPVGQWARKTPIAVRNRPAFRSRRGGRRFEQGR